MKIKKFLVTAAGAFVMACLVWLVLERMRPKVPKPPPPENLPQAIVVYCFQISQRSAKDEKIEQWMREVLDKSFAAQLKDHKIVWRVVNFEEPENAHLARLYDVTATSIVVVDGRKGDSGPATRYQQQAWSRAEDKEAFMKYFRGEIEKALK